VGRKRNRSRSRGRKQRANPTPKELQSTGEDYYALDVFSELSIKKGKQRVESILKYHWDYYFELAEQRTKYLPEIADALMQASV